MDALATELSLDRGLYEVLAAIDVQGADPTTRWLMEKGLRDFRRAGVDKDPISRQI